MNKVLKASLSAAALIALVVGVAYGWKLFSKVPPQPIQPSADSAVPPKTSQPEFDNFDIFKANLAERVKARLPINDKNSFTPVVADIVYPVGTIIHANDNWSADEHVCLPKPPPPSPAGLSGLFPDFTMSSKLAVSASFGSKAVDALAKANAELKQNSTVAYSIKNPDVVRMDDSSLAAVLNTRACRDFLIKNPGVRLIVGAIRGKIDYKFSVDNPAEVSANLSKVSNIKVSEEPGAISLSFADDATQPFVILLSTPTFQAASDSDRLKTVAVLQQIEQQPARNPASTGAHIFVQEDQLDDPKTGTAIVSLLKTELPDARVESRVEHVPTTKMPLTAQVRFSSAQDAEVADQVVSKLKPKYPRVRAVRIGLPAPAGQLEVWLPKVVASN